jgi:inner membrane transporter RhtA
MPALVVAGGLLHVRGRRRATAHRGRDRAVARSVGARLIGPASIIAGSASLQGGAALAASLFAVFGAAGTSALRFLAGAVVLLVLARPRVRGRGGRWWLQVAVFGASMAAANVCLFEAIARMSLGTAVTLQFLGPLTLALLAARRRLDVACAVAAAAGVVLLTGGPSGGSLGGLVLGLGAAACVAIAIVAAERVGRDSAGLEGLALAVAAAALVTLPIGVPAVASGVEGGQLATVAALGVLGIAIPYALFLHAIRQVGAKTYSVLLSLDPAVAMLAGLLVLSQSPRLADVIGVALVTAASATAVSTRSA